MLIVLFLVSHFNFLFVPCGGLSWLPVSFLLHVKHTLSYRIVTFKMLHAAHCMDHVFTISVTDHLTLNNQHSNHSSQYLCLLSYHYIREH